MWHWIVLRRDLSQETQPTRLFGLQEVSWGGLWCATLALLQLLLVAPSDYTGRHREGMWKKYGKAWMALSHF